MPPIPPGSTIGIIGGGQLGRMSAVAAAELGYRCHVYCPDKHAPATEVAFATTIGTYDDRAALERFISAVDVVTFEFENIPHESVKLLARHRPVRPSWEVLKISQNRLREKRCVEELGIGTAAYQAIYSVDDLKTAVESIGTPGVLKTTELGYDGKGQIKIESDTKLKKAWQQLGTHEAIYEQFVPFERELSVIVARSASGEPPVTYPVVENIHRDHILHRTIAPAEVSDAVIKDAAAIATRIAEAIELEGIVAVELFHTQDDTLLVNELAPRPHNSGHWTQDGCLTSQFEQHIRAICGLPLGNTTVLAPTEMLNLIGYEADGWRQYLSNPSAKLHLYGKRIARPGRKMGHVNVVKEPA